MAGRADLWLHAKPGTDLIWINAIASHILAQGWADRAFIDARVNDFAAYQQSLAPYTLERAAAETGIPLDQLTRAAEMIARAESVCTLWAMGVTQHQSGSDVATALSNLMLLTGNYGRPGTGCYPLRGHNNVQGTSDFGCMPNYLPGYQKLDDAEARDQFSRAWGSPVPPVAGLDNHKMIDAVHAGTLRAMYIVGEEISVVDANANYVRDALRKLDFLVIQEVFFSKTAQYADVILPASPSLEKDGTFVNTERRIQRLYQVFPPLPGSKPDWQILQLVANALGAGWHYTHPSEIMEEVASLSPMFAGVSYARLEGWASLQWPIAADGTDPPLLYTERFNFPDGKARFYPVEFRAPLSTDAEYDLHLNNGRLLEHFHEGNLTYRSPGIREKVPSAFVEISPALAAERALRDGDTVRLISQWGHVVVRVLVTDRVQGHELYLPMNDSDEAAVNLLTSNLADRATNTPAYKELPVRLVKVAAGDGVSPLPRTNSRFGHPQPQRGVQVERKWARSDYAQLLVAPQPAPAQRKGK